MLSKLFPIIISDRFDQGGDTFQPSDDRRRNQITRLLRDFDENSVTRLPLDEADDGLLVVGADNGVALPMPNLPTFVDIHRPFRDRPAIDDLPTSVSSAAIPFATFLLTAQMTPQITAGCLVRIDVTIDGLVADIDGSCDLLWAELLLKLLFYVVPDLC